MGHCCWSFLTMAPESAAATSRLPLGSVIFFTVLFFFLQVQGRPYTTDLQGRTTLLDCLPIQLAHPRAKYLEELSFPEGLKSRYILVDSDYNLPFPLKEPKRVVCLASGVGMRRRSPDVAKELLMQHSNNATPQSPSEAKIEGAGIVCMPGIQECSGVSENLNASFQCSMGKHIVANCLTLIS